MVKRAILIDGSSLIYRCFYSLDPKNQDMTDIKVKQRFFTLLQFQIKRWIELNKYSHGMIVFDVEKKSFRNELLPEYKTNRSPMPQELLDWLPDVLIKLNSLGIKAVFCPRGYEGDDLLGTLSRQLSKCDFRVDIFTTDGDLLQLVDYLVSIYKIKTSFKLEIHNHSNFADLNDGLFPCQIPLLKALSGDSCDNYSGIPGIGPKTAIKIIHQYKTFFNLWNSIDNLKEGKIKNNLLEHKELFEKCFKLATIQTNIKYKYALSDCLIKSENNSRIRQSR